MPLYDIKCSRSGQIFERMIKLADFEAPIECVCGSRANRVIPKPMFSVDTTGYHSPVNGDWIGSKGAHQNDLKKHSCRVLEPGETEAAAARRELDDARLDRKVEETVEREIDKMPSAKRERLYNEMVNNDLVVERR